MRVYSEAAWNIATLYSHTLASETRDLAAHIDAALARPEEANKRADEMTTKIAILSHAGMCSMSPQRMFDILEEIYGLCEAAGFDSVGGRKAPVSRK